MKTLYRNSKSGDLFAIETDENGNVLSTCGPPLFNDLDPQLLDYDDYWNNDVKANLVDFQRLTREDYLQLLYKNGFTRQETQKRLF